MQKFFARNKVRIPNFKMASKDYESSSDPDDAPDLTLTREYCDMVLYFSKSGRFQYHSLMDHGRHAGVVTLLTAERVTKLTEERRLRPVSMALTAGGPKQKVYMICLVRQGKLNQYLPWSCHGPCHEQRHELPLTISLYLFAEVTTQELNDNMDRMNRFIDGMTSAEKEGAVQYLIMNTKSRMLPGVRYVPLDWYGPHEVPPSELLDEDGLQVDNSGKPIVASEEEFPVYRPGRPFVKRDNRDVSLPRTTANLSDPETDSDAGDKKKPKVTKRKDIDDDLENPQVSVTSV